MPGPFHFHWCLIVLIGFGLIGHFVLLSFQPGLLPILFWLPYPLFLALVLAGGGFAIWHHWITISTGEGKAWPGQYSHRGLSTILTVTEPL